MKKCTALILALLLACVMVVPVQASEASDNVAAMIAGLPTVEEFAAMDSGMQLEYYNQTQVAYDAWMSLSEEEKAQIDGAEEVFEALFAHFNSLVMPIGETAAAQTAPQSGKTGKLSFNSYAWVLIAALAAVVTVLGRKRKIR